MKPWFIVLVSAGLLLSACGAKNGQPAEGHRFSEAVDSSAATVTASAPEAKPAASGATPAPQAAAPAAVPQADSATAAQASPTAVPSAAAQPAAPTSSAPQAGAQPTAQQAPQSPAPAKAAAAAPAAGTSAPEAKPSAAPAQTPAPAAAEGGKPKEAAKPAPAAANSNEIHWSEFFDDDKQNTPSNKFWDMSGKHAEIKGYMGEVLSLEKHWFLIIPQPGAECPFDNGDETYWNKIMIAFVPESEKLRFTPGPLKISGRLDVGVKIDESGYKTMFRLYDAKFEKIKE